MGAACGSGLWERLFVQGCTYIAAHMDVQAAMQPRIILFNVAVGQSASFSLCTKDQCAPISVRFQAVQGKTRLDVVGFSMAEGFSRLELGESTVNLACELHLNDWNGQNKVELRLLDLVIAD